MSAELKTGNADCIIPESTIVEKYAAHAAIVIHNGVVREYTVTEIVRTMVSDIHIKTVSGVGNIAVVEVGLRTNA